MLGLVALVVILLVLAHWLYRARFHALRGVWEPFPSLPLIGTLYMEFYRRHRSLIASDVAQVHFAKHGGPRLWTEELPVLGRFLVVGDQNEAARLLRAMGSPEAGGAARPPQAAAHGIPGRFSQVDPKLVGRRVVVAPQAARATLQVELSIASVVPRV